jgi:protein SCO1
MMRQPMIVLAAFLMALAFVTPSGAHDQQPAALREVAFEQRLGETVPLGLEFRDERGQSVTLGGLLAGRPAVVSLNQYGCPQLCPLVLEGLAQALRQTTVELGREYVAITIGIDPREGPDVAAGRKRAIARGYLSEHRADGWHFLTGNEYAVRRVAAAVGFRYAYDRANDAYAHPTGVVVVTPEGRVARYLFGVDYGPRDLRLALVEASRGRLGGIADQLLLACYHYDAVSGRYTPAVMAVVRAAGVVTVVGMGLFLLVLCRRDPRR